MDVQYCHSFDSFLDITNKNRNYDILKYFSSIWNKKSQE